MILLIQFFNDNHEQPIRFVVLISSRIYDKFTYITIQLFFLKLILTFGL